MGERQTKMSTRKYKIRPSRDAPRDPIIRSDEFNAVCDRHREELERVDVWPGGVTPDLQTDLQTELPIIPMRRS